MSLLRPVALAAAVLGLTLSAAGAAGAAPYAGPLAATPGTPAPAAAGAVASSVLLINGDQAMTSDGGAAVSVARPPGATGLAGAMVTLHPPGGTLLVPATALPYLGHGLDPSLFEVSALAHAEQDGRLPVTIGYGTTLPTIPGVTVTKHGAGTATGYLTAASAPRFGEALARQFTADHRRGSYGDDGVFGGGVTLRLPGTSTPAQPQFPMHTLTVTGTDLAGKPDTGDEVEVVDATDPARFNGFGSTNDFFHGTTKFSVPAGTYWAVGVFFSGDGFRLDVLPQFSVTGDTTAAMDERAATSQVVLSTPQPTVVNSLSLDLVRGGSHGAFGSGFTAGSLWVNPVATPPAAGTLQTYTSGDLASPSGSATAYSYQLDFPGTPGLIPPQHFTAGPANLATVSESFYQDVASSGVWASFGGTIRQLETTLGFSFLDPLALPGRETLYVSANPAMLWETQYFQFGNNLAGGQSNAGRIFQAGESMAEAWNAYPLHPAPMVALPGTAAFPTQPSAVRAGDKLLLSIEPFGDNTPGHTSSTGFLSSLFGHGGGTAGTYAVYQNGTKIASGNAVKKDGLVTTTLNPAPSTVKYVLTASRTGKHWRLSRQSRDVWTWPSRPAPKATVPAPWECGENVVGGRLVLDRHCVVQGMMNPQYQVAGLSLRGTAQPGAQTLSLSIGHLQQATAWPVTRAGVQVSYDNGTTWQPATLTRTGAEGFRATYTAPASSTVSLRVTARDAHGATVSETITRAYETAA